MTETKRMPRGIRNNNPGNIRWGENWKGLAPDGKSKDKSFCVFEEPKWGIRALCKVLITYNRRYGLDTVQEIISRFAPTSENDTKAYMNHVAKLLGVRPDERIAVCNERVMYTLITSIIQHENGVQPYSEEVIKGAMLMAGIA